MYLVIVELASSKEYYGPFDSYTQAQKWVHDGYGLADLFITIDIHRLREIY